MDYDVVLGYSVEELIVDVKEKITEGYTPVGGICATRYTWTNERKGYEESGTEYVQAMVKKVAGERAPNPPTQQRGMNEAPIKPSEVILESERFLGKKVDSIIRELNPQLRAALERGGGRNEKIYIILSSDARDLVLASPDVAEAVLAVYEETNEWVVYRASEYQWEFYVADSPAGESIKRALAERT